VLCCTEMGYCAGCSVVRRGVAWRVNSLNLYPHYLPNMLSGVRIILHLTILCIRQLFLFCPLPSTVLTSLLYHVLCCTVLTVRTGGECLLRGPSPRPPRRAKRGCQGGKYGPLHCIPYVYCSSECVSVFGWVCSSCCHAPLTVCR
jgi:hypothetical protein